MRHFAVFFLFLLFLDHLWAQTPLDYVNSYREASGLNRLEPNHILEKAAQNHANFRRNVNSGHFESRKYRGFTGVTPQDRAISAGYGTRMVLENISESQSSLDGVEKLMTAIYHRFAFLDFEIDQIGHGKVSKQKQSLDVYVMGNSLMRKECLHSTYKGESPFYYGICQNKKQRLSQRVKTEIDYRFYKSAPDAVLYPYLYARNISPVFYEEEPDPLPQYSMVGNPISVQLHPKFASLHPRVMHAKLWDVASGKQLPLIEINRANDVQKKLKATEFAFFPKQRLTYNHHYQGEVLFHLDQGMRRFNFDFHTKNLGNLTEISRPNQQIKIQNTDMILYFKPKSMMTRLSKSSQALYAFRYTKGVTFRYQIIDSMTLKIHVEGKKGMRVEIRNDAFTPARSVNLEL